MQNVVDGLSCISLHVETYFNDTPVSQGTGFTISKGGRRFLITNWHVLSGRRPETGEPLSLNAAIPNRIVVWLHKRGKLGSWNGASIPLLNDQGEALWTEARHTRSGHMVDIAALPIPETDEVDFYDLPLESKEIDLVVAPSEPVSVVGFPFGKASDGKFAICKTGHVASDIVIDFATKPIFLIDVTSKPGMSGSPVFARRVGAVMTSQGAQIGISATRFLGVYSGRISDQPDDKDNWNLGMVWKASVIDDLLK